MSDAPKDPAEPAVPAAIPAADPAAAPVVPAEPAAAAAAEPAAPAAAEPAAEPAKPAAEAHIETPSLLTKPVEEKPAEEKPAEAKPGEEPKPAEQAKLAPLTYEALTLPEGVTLDADRVKAFDDIIGPHQLSPEARQQLADMHVAEMQRFTDDLRAEQHRVFAQTRKTWRDEVMADEELGGAGHQTALGACFRVIDRFVPEGERAAFDQMLLVTGAGDHPAMLRLLHNVAKALDAPKTPEGGNPPPDRGPNRGKTQGGGMRQFYDHDSSQRAAQG